MNNRLEYLAFRYYENSCTPGEEDEFLLLLKEPANIADLEILVEKQLRDSDGELPLDDESSNIILQAIIRNAPQRSTPVLPMFSWKKIAIAATILITIGLAAWFIIPSKRSSGLPPIAAATNVQPPGKVRATITLADGRIVYLDSIANGAIANQQDVALVKTAAGKIIYTAGASPAAAEVYNTLNNPRGSQVIDMTLADGSRVWLNAGSSITYPVAFTGKERKVTITGEAYFEVAPAYAKASAGKHGEKFPFIVSKGDMEVTVLGTHFNVNAYDDEADIKVTLLEGSVRVKSETVASSPAMTGQKSEAVIKPGEQAIVAATHTSLRGTKQPLTIDHSPDLDEVMAWKEGNFNFNRQTVQAIMRDIARWYNVEVSYQGNISTVTFSGIVSRNSDLSSVLKIMEQAGVRFRVEGNKVMVLQ